MKNLLSVIALTSLLAGPVMASEQASGACRQQCDGHQSG